MSWDTIDYFNDASLNDDPYAYFDELREAAPVLPLPHLGGVVAVTGYDEICEVYRDAETFSSCNSVIGPYAMFPVPLEGDDVGDIIDKHRDELPMFEHMVTMDPPDHTRERALLMRLLTPKRLKENEEFIRTYTQPFAMLVVADLLGVPEEDFEEFRLGFGLAGTPGKLGTEGARNAADPNLLGWADQKFSKYIEDRRKAPSNDVLNDLSHATYPDGSLPPVINVVRTATFLFAAGQETTARLLAAALKHLAENPQTQDYLRTHKERIPEFIEETLRMESPVKTDFRMTRRTTSIAGVEVKAGTPVMLLNGAANRDPRQYECPHDFNIDRDGVRTHIAFGRGNHSCPGGPLARVEGRISIERILERMHDIRLSEEHHGPAGNRTFRYEPTWILRGLSDLHLEWTPA